jgi:putative addiction module component (TIGR02574 family)
MAPKKTLIEKMSLDEKIEWMDAIWTSMEADPEFARTPAWHRAIIDQRLARMQNDPQPGYTIDELFRKLADRRK